MIVMIFGTPTFDDVIATVAGLEARLNGEEGNAFPRGRALSRPKLNVDPS